MAAIVRRFEQVCGIHADLAAVVSGKRVLTYCELNARANQLARMILDRAGNDGGTVGLQLEHGASLCLGVVAFVKAGKVYVPLDPNNPAERQRSILADARTTLLLADGAPEYAPPYGGFLDINQISRAAPDTNLNRPPRDDDCAFLLYTSGSAGRPKGVVYLHGSVVARIADCNRFGVGPGDRLTALGSGGMNFYRALLTGATLVSLNLREVDVGALTDWMRNNRITIYHSVPTVFRHFVSTLSNRQTFPHLRIVNITGETLLSSDVAAFRRQATPSKASRSSCLIRREKNSVRVRPARSSFAANIFPRDTGTNPGLRPSGSSVLVDDVPTRPAISVDGWRTAPCGTSAGLVFK